MNKKILALIMVVAMVGLLIFGGGLFNENDSIDMSDVAEANSMEKNLEASPEDTDMENTEMKDEEMKDEEEKMMEVKNEGAVPPPFELMDLDGNTHKLEDYMGEKVYVKFWASWCSICLAGMDELDTLSGEMNDFKTITIVSPDANGEMSEERFKEWFKGLDTKNIKVLLDVDGKISKAYGVRAFPTSVYIGSDGIMVKRQPGHAGNDSIKDVFEEIH